MARITHTLTDELRKWWEYNPRTGEFLWKNVPSQTRGKSHARVGAQAGSVYPTGYRYLSVKGQYYRAGRLAWFFMTGEDPPGFIDHINGDKSDDRFENLRVADHSQNQANAKWKTNTSGMKGVRLNSGKWMAVITIDGRAKNLGRFDTIVEAAMAYKRAAVHQWGEFALVPTDSEIEALGEMLSKVPQTDEAT